MTPDRPPAVSIAGVTRSFGDAAVLDGVDLAVADGEVVALLGPSGCGKTTLLRVIAGLLRPDAGTVSLGGRTVSGPGVFTPPERRGVGFIFQNGALFPHLDVARNVGYGLPRSERRVSARIDEMLDLVGLSGFGQRLPDSLSGGQAQRVALARALAPAPSVVLLDEPFSNLDALLRTRLRREVGGVVRSAGVSAIFVTHDREEAFSVADRVAVMRHGRIVQEGPPRRVYEQPVDPWVAGFVGDVSDFRGQVVRPEQLELCTDDTPDAEAATVSTVEHLGSTVSTEVVFGDGSSSTVLSLSSAPIPTPGERVYVRRRA